jgi:Holliday junction resolvasome RuvABC ATP-dependent DNA helicase subunit
MYFIGQRHIMNQMMDILPHLYENDVGMNLLMRGPSGWGKTRMSFMICNYLTGGKFEYCLGDKPTFNDSIRVHFIDEVHLLEKPETLYPKMDSGKYIIVLATNDVATLPEALSNRCAEFIFDKYSIPELREISRGCLKVNLPESFIDYIIESGGLNPRIVKGIISRLNIVLFRHPDIVKNMSLVGFKELLEVTFGIRDGMDVMCTRVIDALKTLGGTASLQTLATYVHIDQNTLRYYVEPILLYKNVMRITSKGRSLI